MALSQWLGKLQRPATSGPLDREAIARLYLRGRGIEIGALHQPLAIPPGVEVKYLDRLTTAEQRRHYPELASDRLVEPDIIDDGERLDSIADGSLDFIVACHFLEHCQNPIGAIENFLRVLREEGVILLAVPDMRDTFDRDRTATTLDHLLRDYREGPQWSRRQHFEEWVRIVNKVDDEAWAKNRIEHYMAMDYSIHYHAWTEADLMELMVALRRDLTFPFELELMARIEDECAFVLRKRSIGSQGEAGLEEAPKAPEDR